VAINNEQRITNHDHDHDSIYTARHGSYDICMHLNSFLRRVCPNADVASDDLKQLSTWKSGCKCTYECSVASEALRVLVAYI
jgi:hypothetical protein